jgi:hypothetical protein
MPLPSCVVVATYAWHLCRYANGRTADWQATAWVSWPKNANTWGTNRACQMKHSGIDPYEQIRIL